MRLLCALFCVCHCAFGYQIDVAGGIMHQSSDNTSGYFKGGNDLATLSATLQTPLFSNFFGHTQYLSSINKQQTNDGRDVSFTDISFHIHNHASWTTFHIDPYIGIGIFSRKLHDSDEVTNQPYLPIGLESTIYNDHTHHLKAYIQEDVFFFKPSANQMGPFNLLNSKTRLGVGYSIQDWSFKTGIVLSSINQRSGALDGSFTKGIEAQIQYSWTSTS